MTIEQVDFLPLQPIRVRSNGKRDYDPVAKQRLVQLCVSSGASISGMALKAGVNANQLRKWIGQSRQAAQAGKDALVPFVAVQACTVVDLPKPATLTAGRQAVLSARLPNGTLMELPCGVDDAELIKAIIDVLWRQR
ncbi:IS66-like element accessory protein TnpA [Achromobacter xylosoxidans]|uniref:IS66-like element accessory protein TnpA n=1 Tax=Alcaligenes xylosoxydans xylosoxydans TaxID=85698 RepID=UPI002A75784F|nr:transposase [Achromobacter xylosoxidans]WPQ36857.1 transposase [Achromobacter xylosoxidans]